MEYKGIEPFGQGLKSRAGLPKHTPLLLKYYKAFSLVARRLFFDLMVKDNKNRLMNFCFVETKQVFIEVI